MAGIVIVLIGGVIAWMAAIYAAYEISPIVARIENHAPTAVRLSVALSTGQTIWQGELKPGQSAWGSNRIRGDSHLVVRCKAPGQREQVREEGYFTHGFDVALDINVRSCTDIVIHQNDLIRL